MNETEDEINDVLNSVILELLPMIDYWYDDKLKSKFIEIMGFTDIFKKNRWFGYYQRVGEEKGYFTLEKVIELVRKYKEEYKKKNTIIITKDDAPDIPEQGYKMYTIKGVEYAIGCDKKGDKVKVFELKKL